MPIMILSPSGASSKKDLVVWRGPTLLAGRRIGQKLLDKLDAVWDEARNHYETKCCHVDVLDFFEKVSCFSNRLEVWISKSQFIERTLIVPKVCL